MKSIGNHHAETTTPDPTNSVPSTGNTAVAGTTFHGLLSGQPVSLRVRQSGLEILPNGDRGEGLALTVRFELLHQWGLTPVRRFLLLSAAVACCSLRWFGFAITRLPEKNKPDFFES